MKLTPKQKKFCDNYLVSGNATESAIKAGYSKRTAKEMGCENLTKPNLTNYIKSKSVSNEISTVMNMQEIRETWTKLIRDDKTTETKDRLKASEMLAKTYGAFLDKVEHSGDVGINITVRKIKK